MTHQRNRLLLLAVPVLLATLASACSSTSNADSSPSSPTTSAPAVTTTLPPTSTGAPTTTEAPTTTAAPTTTVAPLPTLPSNVESVGVFAGELKAVGGKSGAATQVIQMRLEQLGFWTGGHDGQYGFATTQAVMAFQKYVGLKASGKVDTDTAAYLKNFGDKAHGSSNTGTLVEVDKTKQLLFIVQNGKTVWTLNTSTGSGIPYEATNKKDPTKIEKGDAITPNGLWKTNRERPEGWWEGDLGKIYRPKYFHGGVAIHGMTSVPNYPASHGCVRVSTQAMDFIWDSGLVPLGTPVWVHGG
jgi:peptidoglycan hydrolase-like protein with peptidoglycan-binding domain